MYFEHFIPVGIPLYVLYFFLSGVYKCPATESYYTVEERGVERIVTAWFNSSCENDPGSYQACGLTRNYFSGTNALCGIIVSDSGEGIEDFSHNRMPTQPTMENRNMTTLRSGQKTLKLNVCDGVCQGFKCEDEAVCNGFTYGVYCPKDDETEIYFGAPRDICSKSFIKYCPAIYTGPCKFQFTNPKMLCQLTNENYNNGWALELNKAEGFLHPHVLVTNYTRCRPPGSPERFYCEDGLDETNCSDPKRVGVECEINRFRSTVSKYRICAWDPTGQVYVGSLCDDGIDGKCYDQRPGNCRLHKHQFCDKIKHCEDSWDEESIICISQTKRKCRRRVGSITEHTIPLEWLMDGEVDCVQGEDEKALNWKTCGIGRSHRFVPEDTTCHNVYLCETSQHKESFVRLEDLCDGIETCGNENSVCRASRRSPVIYSRTTLTGRERFARKMFYCQKGLQGLQRLAESCASKKFIFPDDQFLGVTRAMKLIMPDVKFNCNSMFGENYVYSSCTDKCTTTHCPLTRIPKHGSCPGQYKRRRVSTLANNQYLALFIKYGDSDYRNDIFVCDNALQCVEYAQVCDLIKDCNDGSDEKICTNHFQCQDTLGQSNETYITITSKCDVKFDCLDLSDECNDQCSSQILDGRFLKMASWIMGAIAIIANVIAINHNTYSMQNCQIAGVLICKVLINLISLGDLMIGLYLLIVSIFDLKYGYSYCKNQVFWLTSTTCSDLGVISTIGSQISLFSMTALSMVRLREISRPLSFASTIDKKTVLCSLSLGCGVVITAVLIAMLPLSKSFEDFFINGLYYDPELRLFIGFVDKETHFQILEQYYGRMRNMTLSWETIRKMVAEMFSKNHEETNFLDNTKSVGFYGNDGVCLFKYFVKENDPQKLYVWIILAINFICFLFISISYTTISSIAKDSIDQTRGAHEDRERLEKQKRLNRKISIIILSDFLSWMPFITVALLHFLEVLDATPWYSYFSMIILPINSVINPLVYDDILVNFMSTMDRFLQLWGWRKAPTSQPNPSPIVKKSVGTVEVEMQTWQGTSCDAETVDS